jgi:hypothetical protein
MRTRHMSLRTERAYLDWMRRYIRFHRRQHPRVLGELKGGYWLIASLLYGSGLRLHEVLAIRVKDLDVGRGAAHLRPVACTPPLPHIAQLHRLPETGGRWNEAGRSSRASAARRCVWPSLRSVHSALSAQVARRSRKRPRQHRRRRRLPPHRNRFRSRPRTRRRRGHRQ